MSSNTTNYNLVKPAGNDYYDISVQNENMDIIDATLKGNAEAIVAVDNSIDTHLTDYVRQPGYGVTTGSANTYAVTLSPAPAAYTAGMGITMKINVANTGASTLNINGLGAKPILDSKGNAMTSGKLRLNGVYTLRYDGTNFILQGEGASGNATASDLLSGKTASTDAGEITGTMPNRGTVNITPSTANQTILSGYHSGSGVVYGDTDLIAANIKSGVNIFGVNGSVIEATGAAVGGEVLSGKTFSRAGAANLTGTMPNRSGVETNAAANHTVAGIVKLAPQIGYYDGAAATRVVLAAADLQAANILAGKSILGIAGTAINGEGRLQFAHGMLTHQANKTVNITGLAFAPKLIILNIYAGSGPGYSVVVYVDKTFFGMADSLAWPNGGTEYKQPSNQDSAPMQVPLTPNASGFTGTLPTSSVVNPTADRIGWLALG